MFCTPLPYYVASIWPSKIGLLIQKAADVNRATSTSSPPLHGRDISRPSKEHGFSHFKPPVKDDPAMVSSLLVLKHPLEEPQVIYSCVCDACEHVTYVFCCARTGTCLFCKCVWVRMVVQCNTCLLKLSYWLFNCLLVKYCKKMWCKFSVDYSQYNDIFDNGKHFSFFQLKPKY